MSRSKSSRRARRERAASGPVVASSLASWRVARFARNCSVGMSPSRRGLACRRSWPLAAFLALSHYAALDRLREPGEEVSGVSVLKRRAPPGWLSRQSARQRPCTRSTPPLSPCQPNVSGIQARQMIHAYRLPQMIHEYLTSVTRERSAISDSETTQERARQSALVG